MRPRSGSAFDVRHMKSWSSSSAEGCLKLKTWKPASSDDFTEAVRGAYGYYVTVPVGG